MSVMRGCGRRPYPSGSDAAPGPDLVLGQGRIVGEDTEVFGVRLPLGILSVVVDMEYGYLDRNSRVLSHCGLRISTRRT